MKKTKKLFALLLVFAMVFTMGIGTAAFAAGETGSGSITVSNPIAGQTYTAYKIFDVKYNDSKSAYSYTISSSSEWYTTVEAYSDITLTASAKDSTLYVVTKKDGFSAAEFADTLKADVSGKTGTPLAESEGKASASGLDLGYYFVSSTSGALCNLTTTNPSVIIYDKNDVPFTKTDDKTSANVGETVKYTITGKVPDTTGFSTYTYKITDTMSTGLTFNKNVTVKLNETDITGACTVTNKANGFELTIPVVNYQTNIGKEILVEYTATVNKNAVATIQKNEAQLEYSNGPTTTTETAEDVEEVYTSKIVIDKYAAEDDSKKLADAKFKLYKEITESGTTTKYYYKVDTNGVVSWVTNKTDATEVTTDANGAAHFDGIADGTYYLEETDSPAGYNLMTTPQTVVVNGNTALSVEADVPNSTGTVLPTTGGIGTTIFYVFGGLLMIGALVFFITRKRMGSSN